MDKLQQRVKKCEELVNIPTFSGNFAEIIILTQTINSILKIKNYIIVSEHL